jgi:hypothetical protein
LTTHNHASLPGNTAPWMYQDAMAISLNRNDNCAKVKQEIDECCDDESEFAAAGPPPDGSCSRECCDAKKCALAPYGSGMQCCDGKTKHHLVPDHCFKDPGKAGGYYDGIEDLNYDKGLAICVDGEDKDDADAVSGELKTHGKIHGDFDRQEDWHRDHNSQQWKFDEACETACDVVGFHTQCDKKCLKQQTETFYRKKKIHGSTTLRANSQARRNQSRVDRAEMGNNQVIWSIPGK